MVINHLLTGMILQVWEPHAAPVFCRRNQRHAMPPSYDRAGGCGH